MYVLVQEVFGAKGGFEEIIFEWGKKRDLDVNKDSK